MAGGSSRWRLSIVGSDGERRAVPLPRAIVVGRDRDVDLRLDDQSVSRKHAKLYFDEEGALWVEDLGSGNGVFLDGKRLREAAAVPNGGKIRLGVFTLTAEDVKGPVAALAKGQPAEGGGTPAVKAPPKPAGPPPPAGCALRGRAGPFLNKDFVLQKPVVKVGRVQDGNDIAVQDDSISREHARLTRAGRGYVLRDLGSANGTSVNGERILERPIEEGDIVRFGTVEFEYFGPPAMVAKPIDPRRKRLIFAGAGALALALVVMFSMTALRTVDQDRKPADDNPTADSITEAERQVGLAQDARRDEQWERAQRDYEQAMKLDPINMDARKGLKEVAKEIETKQYIDRAKQRVDVGQDEDGVELYLKVGAESIYYPRAQAEIARLASLLIRRYTERCHAATKSGDPAGIAESCGHYLDLVCNSRVDDSTLKQVRAAEKKLGAKLKGEPWECSQKYAWVGGSNRTPEETLEKRIADKYKDPHLAENVRIYANGQAKSALATLGNLKETPAEAHNADLDKLKAAIELAYGYYSDGVSSLETGDVRTARDRWQQLFEADQQIMPQGYQSELVNQARQQLAHQYLKQGKSFFTQERWAEAFQQFQQGLQVLPADNDLGQAVHDLEEQAYQMVKSPKSCQELRTVLAMTVDKPQPSFAHQEAQRQGKDHRCKGF